MNAENDGNLLYATLNFGTKIELERKNILVVVGNGKCHLVFRSPEKEPTSALDETDILVPFSNPFALMMFVQMVDEAWGSMAQTFKASAN